MQYKVAQVAVINAFKLMDKRTEVAAQQLNEVVACLIAEGWRPQAGVSIAAVPGGIFLTQAMVKD